MQKKPTGPSAILDPIVSRIKALPSAHWEALAKAAGCAVSLPRKLACGDRSDPKVRTLDPLYVYFKQVDAGVKVLPGQAPAVITGNRRTRERRESDQSLAKSA